MIDFKNSKYAQNMMISTSIVKKTESGKMYKVMVYGTLRAGCGNHRLLIGSKLLGQYTVPGYKMYSAGGFPYCVKTNNMNETIETEVYLVDDETLEDLDGLEGVKYDHYKRVPVERSGFDEVLHMDSHSGDMYGYSSSSADMNSIKENLEMRSKR